MSSMQQDTARSKKKQDRVAAVVILLWLVAIADWFLTQKLPVWMTAILFIGATGYAGFRVWQTSQRPDHSPRELNFQISVLYVIF